VVNLAAPALDPEMHHPSLFAKSAEKQGSLNWLIAPTIVRVIPCQMSKFFSKITPSVLHFNEIWHTCRSH